MSNNPFNQFNPWSKKKSREHVSSSSEEQQEEASKQEDEGEGSYPAEEFCIPGDVVFDLGFYYSDFIRYAVNLSLIDGVTEEAVAVLVLCAIEIDGVGLLIDFLPVVDVDGIVVQLVDIDSVAGHMLCHLQVAIGGTACQHEG